MYKTLKETIQLNRTGPKTKLNATFIHTVSWQ